MRGSDRPAPIDLDAGEFRQLGHDLVDGIADFLNTLPERPVAPGKSADEVRDALGRGGLPEQGTPSDELLAETARLLFEHSTFNGHPRFLAYITASASPIGALGDLLAATVNPKVGGWALSPVATEIEAQTVRWIAELLGYPADCGGLLVSGGNMANFVGFLAARRTRAPVKPGAPDAEEYLNELNRELRDRLEQGGETYVSNAVVGDTYLLRACVVNFRTTAADIAALPVIVKRVGAEVHADRNPLRAA